MAYTDVATLARDNDFALRTTAAHATETLEDPGVNSEFWQRDHAWKMAAQPGFGDAYAYAINTGVTSPGKDAAVITDNQILAAVQSIMAMTSTQEPA